jgi:hypothetical protein
LEDDIYDHGPFFCFWELLQLLAWNLDSSIGTPYSSGDSDPVLDNPPFFPISW